MKPQYFDIHSHLNFEKYDNDREQVIGKLAQEKIWTNTVGTDLETSKEAVALADETKHLYATIGLHPSAAEAASAKEVSSIKTFDEQEFEKLVVHPKVVAIGECGLDYFVSPKHSGGGTEISVEEKKRQKREFEKQIEFAVKHNKPLMIHCRNAYPDCLDILSSFQKVYGKKVRGNFHFFTEPVETAKKVLDIGFTVSFTGPITFVGDLEGVVKFVPLESMMAETDAPFAAPVPYRGQRNEPKYVQEIVGKIARIKKIDFEKVRAQLVDNSLSFFGIKEV
jgi:TatD DNase family protein